MDGPHDLSGLREVISRLSSAVADLERMFPGRHFTLDGHIVGSLGEVIAAHVFGLRLLPPSSKGRDAIAPDGRDVEIKLTQGKRVAFREEPAHLIVLSLTSGAFVVEYNGPGSRVWCACGGRGSNGQRSVSLSRIRQLQRDNSEQEMLPRAVKWDLVR